MRGVFYTQQEWVVGEIRLYLARVGSEYVPCVETGSEPVIVGRGDPYPTLDAGIRYCDHVVAKLRNAQKTPPSIDNF